MTLSKKAGYLGAILLVTVLAQSGFLRAADGPDADEVTALKAQIAAQQKQLERLQAALASQQKLLERITVPPNPAASPASAPIVGARLREVSSLTPTIPPLPLNPTLPVGTAQGSNPSSGNPCADGYEGGVPPYLRLGNVCIQPVGFMDFTTVWRDKNEIGRAHV